MRIEQSLKWHACSSIPPKTHEPTQSRMAAIDSIPGSIIDSVRASTGMSIGNPHSRMPGDIDLQKVYPRHALRNVSTSTTLVDIRLLANGALHCSMSMLAWRHAEGDAGDVRFKACRESRG
jgi:hypothetical protein